MNTPDPIVTTEQIAAIAASGLTAAAVLFKLNLTDAQQAAAVTLIGIAYTVFTLIHAAWVRGKRTTVAAAQITAKAAKPVVVTTSSLGPAITPVPPTPPKPRTRRRAKPTTPAA